MTEEFENSSSPGYPSFEMMFKWGEEWVGIEVVPMKDDTNRQHYIIRFSNDMVVVLQKDQFGDWVELKEGSTELARHLGSYMPYLAYC